MSIVSIEMNGRSCRTYLLYHEVSREAILIDPLMNRVQEYVRVIEQTKLELTHIIDTHTHADHLSGGTILKEHTGCDYVMYNSSKVSGVSWSLYEGLLCRLGRDHVNVRIYHTPGHTKDSVSIVLPDRMFVGDLLFLDEGGAGRLDLPGGDIEEHWDSLQRILGLPDHLVIYPAHDYRNCAPSTIAVQKTRNQYLQPRTREEYVAFAKGLRYGPAEWMKRVLQLNEECCEMRMRAFVMPNTGNACENVCESVVDVSMPRVSVADFYAQYKSSACPVVLDVRETDELIGDLPALPGIIHIPVGQIEERIQELDAHREKPIVVICRSGKRALRAASFLAHVGFGDVSVLSGGMLAWRDAVSASIKADSDS